MTGARILVLGGTGYVGGRLVPHLLDRGHSVRCLTRSADGFEGVAWADDVEIVLGDLFDPDSLDTTFRGIDTVVYLVHSLGSEDFERKEVECASNTRIAAERAGVRHIVYLSGLGDDATELSAHLRSRHAVGRTLADGPVDVTELRAAVVIGAGSASFEMLRNLTDVIPVMTAPRWVSRTRLQPIAIADVLVYLTAAVERDATGAHDVVEIGGPDTMTYADLVHVYASVCGLRRFIIPIPVVSPGLSTHWVNLVTPMPKQLAASLIDSLRNDVVVTDDSASTLSTHQPISTRSAVERAVAVVTGSADLAANDTTDDTTVPDVRGRPDPAHPRPWDPKWAGGALSQDRREYVTSASAETLQRTVRGIGGERGWFGFRLLWTLRGILDRVAGGVGLQRGRAHPDEIAVGDTLDFWRVAAVDDDLFRLRGEMKLPGVAWLEWTTEAHPDGTLVVQHARYQPRGLLGRLYWLLLTPFHAMIFPLMLRGIIAAAEEADETDGAAPTESDRRAPVP